MGPQIPTCVPCSVLTRGSTCVAMNTEDQVRLVSIPRCAELLSVSGSTVRRMIRSGELRSVRVGTRLLVPLTELKALADERPTALPVKPTKT